MIQNGTVQKASQFSSLTHFTIPPDILYPLLLRVYLLLLKLFLPPPDYANNLTSFGAKIKPSMISRQSLTSARMKRDFFLFMGALHIAGLFL